MTDDKLQSIADKIRKIIAKAESTTNDDEADAFMAKAQSMMIEHGLSLLDIGRLDAEDPVGHDKDFAYHSQSSSWRTPVVSSLASLYGCQIVRSHRGNQTYFTLFGRESARVTTTLMWPYVDRQVLRLARAAHAAGEFPSASVAASRIGYALALRIDKLVREERQREVKTATGRGLNALVPVDLIDAEMKSVFPRLVFSRPRTVKVSAAATKAAASISLHKQTGGSNIKRLA